MEEPKPQQASSKIPLTVEVSLKPSSAISAQVEIWAAKKQLCHFGLEIVVSLAAFAL